MKKLTIALALLLFSSSIALAENELLLVGTALTTTSVGGAIYATVTLISKKAQNDLEEYIDSNKMLVARDMSKADGESLQVISDILEIDEASRSEFYASLQENYSEIFDTDAVQSKDVTIKVCNIASSYM